MFHYKTYYDLSRDIAAGIQTLPSVDIVVGIPRSGIIPGMIISAFLNIPNYDLDSFVFANSPRSGFRKLKPNSGYQVKPTVLVVDDSVNTGAEMRRVRARLEPLCAHFNFVYCAIYAVDADALPSEVDFALATLPHPRVFQWNYRSHIIAEHACFDMDGVLCADPREEDNDDGARYIEFIATAKPLFIPRKKVSAIVTSRLEKYRAHTIEWLDRNEVKYGELIMLDMPSAEARRRAKAHAPFKAEVFRARSEIVFVESSWKQAIQIAQLADKAVICTENDVCLLGAEHLSMQDHSGELFGPEVLRTQESLRREVSRLSKALTSIAVTGGGKSLPLERSIEYSKANRSPWFAARALRRLASSSSSNRMESDPSGNIEHERHPKVAMISYSFDKRLGAGAAESSTRLCRALRKAGVEVHTLSRESFDNFAVDSSAQPALGTAAAFWNSNHNQFHSRQLRAKLDEIAPDIVVLGAVDRGIVSLADIVALPYPIVWINRDNWCHTGGCLFQLGDTKADVTDSVSESVYSVLSCRQYVDSCSKCPAIKSDSEKCIAAAQYQMKQIAYSARPDIVFAPISPWLGRAMNEASLTKGRRIVPIFNPIDRSTYKQLSAHKQQLRAELGLPLDGNLVLLAAHRIDNPRKGAALLFNAIENCGVASNIRFVVIGNQSDTACPKSIAQRFVSLGFIDDDAQKVKLYNAVNATVVPTLQESLSVVASDSLCCGTPVVAFNTSGIADFVRHRINGYLATPFDPVDLARGINWVCAHEDWSALSAAAVSTAADCFDEEKNVRAYLSLFQDTIERYRAGIPIDAAPPIQSHRSANGSGVDDMAAESGTSLVTTPRDSNADESMGAQIKATSSPLLTEANRYMREGRYEEAYAIYARLFEDRPLHIYQTNMRILERYMRRRVTSASPTKA